MNIIDEMRNEAANLRTISPYTYEPVALLIEQWADRLAVSGALVSVPDGEKCEMEYLDRHHFVVVNNMVCVPDKIRIEWVRITDNKRICAVDDYQAGAMIQPVRLVPLTEVKG